MKLAPFLKAPFLHEGKVDKLLLGAEFLEGVRGCYPKLYTLSLALLGVVFLHDLPAMITRYRALF